MLDALAQRYGKLPSEILKIDNEFVAMTIDLHCLNAGLENEKNKPKCPLLK